MMMATCRIQRDFSLKDENSLRLDVSSKYYVIVHSVAELKIILSNGIVAANKVFILGGGSNILLTKDYQGVVLKINIKGIQIVYEDDQYVHVEIGAGEDWPSVVEYVVSNGWGGIENLASVPGTAGAAPVQNIACYGHNLHETLLSVDAINLANGFKKTFSADECDLGYRTSIFKTKLSGQYVIVSIVLKLNKFPVLNTSYKSRYESVENELFKIGRPPYNVKDVYQAIVNIRKRKLPDITTVGTVGSVFKNPLITQKQLAKVKKLCPDIHYYPANHLIYTNINCNSGINDEMVKIPAAWLIEDMGWAGKRVGNCGIWKTQPLNIVNYGNATPEEYLSFINMVKDAVFNKYSVFLYPEAVIV